MIQAFAYKKIKGKKNKILVQFIDQSKIKKLHEIT